MRVVVDTNIVVSSYIVPVGAPARIMAAWRSEVFELVVSTWVLTEYEHSLNYPRVRRRHGLTPERIAQDVADIRELALLVEPPSVPRVVPDDPDDDQILAVAVAGQAEYIVSGDPDLLNLHEYQGIRMLSPATFLALLTAGEA